MARRYDLPTLPQYVFNRQLAEYQYRPGRYSSKLQIVQPYKPVVRPLEDRPFLEDRVFPGYLDKGAESWNFISDQADVETNQLELLLGQLAARHNISRNIHETLDYRNTLISSQLSGVETGACGYRDPLGLKIKLESRLEEVDRERNMEYVALWRDSQKLLGDLFRHWTAYSNLTRRGRVINDGV